MPDDSEHPVILGDLRVSKTEATHPEYWSRPATVADLVSALRAEGVATRVWWCRVHKEAGDWTEPPYQMLQCSIGARLWASSPNAEKTCDVAAAVIVLDALAEAQPLPPAGR